jgi:branched-subunit amino acid ABC-type transport system permease component
MPSPLLPMAMAVALMAGLAILIKTTRRMANDRLALTLRVLGFTILLNGIESHMPTDPPRFGFGFPQKFAYDPAYVHTGLRGHQHAVLPYSQWRFDATSLAIDLATVLIMGGIAMAINEVVQRTRGNRPEREWNLNDPGL